eukprot:3937897-Rhodomonas_salina.1
MQVPPNLRDCQVASYHIRCVHRAMSGHNRTCRYQFVLLPRQQYIEAKALTKLKQGGWDGGRNLPLPRAPKSGTKVEDAARAYAQRYQLDTSKVSSLFALHAMPSANLAGISIRSLKSCSRCSQQPRRTTRTCSSRQDRRGRLCTTGENCMTLATRTARAGLTSTTTGWHSYKCGLWCVIFDFGSAKLCNSSTLQPEPRSQCHISMGGSVGAERICGYVCPTTHAVLTEHMVLPGSNGAARQHAVR